MRMMQNMVLRTGSVARLGLAAVIMAFIGWSVAAAAQPTYRLDPGSKDFKKTVAADPGSPEGKLQTARELIAKEDFSSAKHLLDHWIDDYPNHPALPEAYFLRGDVKVGRNNYYKALFDYEAVAQDYPDSPQFNLALEREFEIAKRFLNGARKRFLGMRIVPAHDDAREILILIQRRVPGSDLGEQASLLLAEYYYNEKNMLKASEAYEMFLKNYPRSLRHEQAMQRLIEASLASYKGPAYDATGLVDAGQRIKTFQTEFPATAEKMGGEALTTRVDEGLARQTFDSGRWYEKRGQKVSAIYTYQRVVRDFPRSAAARNAIERLKDLNAPVAFEPQNQPTTSAPATRPAS